MVDNNKGLYRIGDVFTLPKPASEKLRLRVREIVKKDYWDGPQYAMQLRLGYFGCFYKICIITRGKYLRFKTNFICNGNELI